MTSLQEWAEQHRCCNVHPEHVVLLPPSPKRRNKALFAAVNACTICDGASPKHWASLRS